MYLCTLASVCVCVQRAGSRARMISLTHVLKEKGKGSARGDDFSTHLGNFDL